MWKGATRPLLEASYVGMSSRGSVGTATPHLWELRSGSKLTEVCFVLRDGGNGGTVRGTRAAEGDAWTGPRGSGPSSAPRQPGPQTANTFLPLGRLDGDQVQAGRSGSGQSLLLLVDRGLPALSSCVGQRARGSFCSWEGTDLIMGPPSSTPTGLPPNAVPQGSGLQSPVGIPHLRPHRPHGEREFALESVTSHVNDTYSRRVCWGKFPGTLGY